MTQMIQPSDNALTANLSKLAGFIEQRAQQKKQIGQITKNSLSKSKNNDQKKKTSQTEENFVRKIFKKLSEQLQEGHTILGLEDLNFNNQQNINYHDAFLALEQEGWVTLLNSGWQDRLGHGELAVNTPIVVDTSDTHIKQYWVIWLHRHWYAEHRLAKQLLTIAKRPVNLLAVDDSEAINQLTPNSQQKIAIDKALHQALSIIIGGPGTGKTFTVAQLVTKLQAQHDKQRLKDKKLPPLSISLTAPTGKAAQRMQTSLQNSLHDQNIALDNAKTIHRLLGIGLDGVPRYHAKNPLPDDLIIVDEASMLGLELAGLLVDAIKPTGRLILLGDANQLAAVDAGSVLSDLCQIAALQPYITALNESKRFDDQSAVGVFAAALQQNVPATQKIKHISRLLDTITLTTQSIASQSSQSSHLGNALPIPFYKISAHTPMPLVYAALQKPYYAFFELIKQWYVTPVDVHDANNRQQLFEVFDGYRVLCAGHQGALGTEIINQKMAAAFFSYSHIVPTKRFFYHGLPIIMTHNDYQLGLFNGDIGICLVYEQQLWACFMNQVIPIHRLSLESCERAYAMTIHKSQGSEFDEVAICMDKAHTRLLSQALLYTAVTRSKNNLAIFGSYDALKTAVTQRSVRQTGLQLQFEGLAADHQPHV